MCGVMMTLSSSWNGKRDGRADKILEKHQELTKLVYHGGMGKPLELDRSASTPLAEQIPKGISAAIASGVLAPGARLPSWLDLAARSPKPGATAPAERRAHARSAPTPDYRLRRSAMTTPACPPTSAPAMTATASWCCADFAEPRGLRRAAGARRRAGRRLRSRCRRARSSPPRPGSTATRYFLDSGGEIRFFFEEDAFDGDRPAGQPKARAQQDRPRAARSRSGVRPASRARRALAALAAGAGLRDPLLLQSMYIFKQPHIGGEVGWHQDATYLHTEPTSVVGLWFALEDAARDNGCLWVLPGGHRGPLRQRFVRAPERPCAGRSRRHALARRRARCRWRRARARWWCCTACCRTGARPTAPAGRAMPIRCTWWTALRAYPADNWLRRDPAFPARGFGIG